MALSSPRGARFARKSDLCWALFASRLSAVLTFYKNNSLASAPRPLCFLTRPKLVSCLGAVRIEFWSFRSKTVRSPKVIARIADPPRRFRSGRSSPASFSQSCTLVSTRRSPFIIRRWSCSWRWSPRVAGVAHPRRRGVPAVFGSSGEDLLLHFK